MQVNWRIFSRVPEGILCAFWLFMKGKSRINSTESAVGSIGVAQVLQFQLFDRVEMLLEMILLSQYAWWP